jgi:hypothetical protein
MNRAMHTELTRAHGVNGHGAATGVLFTQVGEGDLPTSQFWVSRDEAPDVIRMLADAFDLDVEVRS